MINLDMYGKRKDVRWIEEIEKKIETLRDHKAERKLLDKRKLIEENDKWLKQEGIRP